MKSRRIMLISNSSTALAVVNPSLAGYKSVPYLHIDVDRGPDEAWGTVEHKKKRHIVPVDPPAPPKRVQRRNSKCCCGSGKKAKRCCVYYPDGFTE